jgi:hypothetical protein
MVNPLSFRVLSHFANQWHNIDSLGMWVFCDYSRRGAKNLNFGILPLLAAATEIVRDT